MLQAQRLHALVATRTLKTLPTGDVVASTFGAFAPDSVLNRMAAMQKRICCYPGLVDASISAESDNFAGNHFERGLSLRVIAQAEFPVSAQRFGACSEDVFQWIVHRAAPITTIPKTRFCPTSEQ